ncbi:MAG: hypothetical protein GY839_10425, partial [candidate division Zixibacteria bacterium]|nr:hypothetical protein [candidate division Zixibacteria bacterium]
SSSRADGIIQKFGKILAIWIFVIATFFPICGAYATISGKCPMNKIMQQIEMKLAE